MIQVRLEQALYQVARTVVGLVGGEAEWGLDHRLVHLAGGSKASRRKALISQLRSQLSLRSHLVLGQTMIKARNGNAWRQPSGMVHPCSGGG